MQKKKIEVFIVKDKKTSIFLKVCGSLKEAETYINSMVNNKDLAAEGRLVEVFIEEPSLESKQAEAWDILHSLFSGLDYWYNDMESNQAEAKCNRQVLKFALKHITRELQKAKDLIRGKA